MVCIYCQGDLAVSNSRPQKSRNQTWRRRLCKACGAVFTSIEAIDLSQAIIVSKTADNSPSATSANAKPAAQLHQFDRDKLFISIYESLRHRPSAASDARGLCDTTVAHIIKTARNGHIGSRSIAGIVLNTLRNFDAAAATHYTAFHADALRNL